MMIGAAALLTAIAAGGISPAYQSGVEAFVSVCAASTTMETMKVAAKSQGWVAEEYPNDIRAGFLAEMAQQSQGNRIGYAEIFSRRLSEGDAYLIVSRLEPIVTSIPASHLCQLRIFDYSDSAPVDLLSEALGARPLDYWNDEFENEVANWVLSNNAHARFQLARTLSQTSLAGPSDISGLSISVEYSEYHQ